MIFGGLQKNSFIDYPGRISCVVFLSGCNFHCPYCHNPGLARGSAVDGDDLNLCGLLDFLAARRGLLDAVVVSGGEPTLQPDLAELCGCIREAGYPVKLDTNGSNPDAIRHLLADNLVDYIAMDIKTAPEGYVPGLAADLEPARLLASIDLIMHSGRPYEFRTTCVQPFVDPAIITAITSCIAGAERYVLQTFRPETVMDPRFFTGSRRGATAAELENFRRLAAPHVRQCLVR
ncbi:MAG: anaerobic ribonucleoside-triphosphate reductase activating protein [Desulfobacterales bacterium]|jgi:pyruvate formate lyase activating enzyme|nr:anaerobic ribonucleoside-triphosphate reductase activating protein [Desulfobacterales bacterium]